MFADAIEDDYYFEMFVEDLPMWGYIGEVEGEELLLGHLETAHRSFKIDDGPGAKIVFKFMDMILLIQLS